ncbi:hypothetical protein TNCV_4003811 [Trichonephila clavipes]|nr:hypothetical protein TNCV_4003811 [Trichonephila clavipes]
MNRRGIVENGRENDLGKGYTRAFGDRSCNFEPWSSDEDDTYDLASPLQTSTLRQREDNLRLKVHQPLNTAGVQRHKARTRDTKAISS